jgi:hypothetical protein
MKSREAVKIARRRLTTSLLASRSATSADLSDRRTADMVRGMDDGVHGFKEGDLVWVEDGDGKHHPGVFVGDNEAAGWFGGGPSAYVVHPEAHQAEVVSLFRITPRDE